MIWILTHNRHGPNLASMSVCLQQLPGALQRCWVLRGRHCTSSQESLGTACWFKFRQLMCGLTAPLTPPACVFQATTAFWPVWKMGCGPSQRPCVSSCASRHPQFPTQTCRQPDVERTSTRWDPSASTSASLDTTCLALLGSPRSKWCWEHPPRLQGGRVRSTDLFDRKHSWLCWRLYQEYSILSHAKDIKE